MTLVQDKFCVRTVFNYYSNSEMVIRYLNFVADRFGVASSFKINAGTATGSTKTNTSSSSCRSQNIG